MLNHVLDVGNYAMRLMICSACMITKLLTSADICFSLTLATTAEMLIRPVKVKLFCGDITKEKTDAIVSSTNTSLNLNSGKQFNGRHFGQNNHHITTLILHLVSPI